MAKCNRMLIGLIVLAMPLAGAQTATLSITRQNPKALAPAFSGFNVVGSDTPADFADEAFRKLVRPLNAGVLRWPGGTVDDMFNWKTGQIEVPADPNSNAWTMIDVMRAHFLQYPDKNFNKQITSMTTSIGPTLFAKGGNPLGDSSSGFAAFADAVGATRLMIVVNAVSDTVASAKALAYYVARNRIPVAGFELVNEPFYLTLPDLAVGPLPGAAKHGRMPPAPGAFLNGQDYAAKMKPYYDAIKSGYASAGEPGGRAVVAIAGGYATDTSQTTTAWANDLASYAQAQSAYWDAVVMHFYPTKSKSGAFADAVTYANTGLNDGTEKYLATFKNAPWSRDKKLFVSEYDVTFDDKAMNGSIYGGLFAAEYIMRMSGDPVVKNVLMHELTNQIDGLGAPPTAVGGRGNWAADLKAAGTQHQKMNTNGRLTGLYYNAQALAVAVANRAVNASDQVYQTSFAGSLGTVKTLSSVIPAVRGQAYHGKGDTMHILLTNKGPTACKVVIQVDGKTVDSTFNAETVAATAGDPSERNTASAQTIQIRNSTSAGSVNLPGYAVMHLWQAAEE